MKKMKILNSKGEPIVLNEREQKVAAQHQRFVNDLGFQIDITTMTQITKKVTEQKFFEVQPSLYLPIVAGQGAWSSDILTYRSFAMGDDFETGLINNSNSNGKLAAVDAGVDSVSVKNNTWAKSLAWTIPQIEEAARTGVWDVVTAKEEARKKNWDLGVQRIAFLGAKGNSSRIKGLYTQSIASNLTLITKSLSSMSSDEFNTFCANVVGSYRQNNSFTANATHFIIPELDYDGLGSATSASFPLLTKLEYLEKLFKTAFRNPNFQILPCAYGENSVNALGVQRYILLNYDEKSLKMDIPVPYTNTLANSIDSFHFQNVGYGQFTGVVLLRPLELMYMDYTPA